MVEFPLPDLASRGRLWRRHLPAPALAADVDIDALAGLYPVPGRLDPQRQRGRGVRRRRRRRRDHPGPSGRRDAPRVREGLAPVPRRSTKETT